jgi:catechol 2,3-dioxygenase-like lactoylglutathione lyase family enzyme
VTVTDIDHVQIAALSGCEEQARRFFGELLGLEELEKPEPLRSRGGCWFRVGSRQLHLGVEKDFRPAGKAHPAFAVRDIDVVFGALSGAGVRCTWDHTLSGSLGKSAGVYRAHERTRDPIVKVRLGSTTRFRSSPFGANAAEGP